MPTFAMAALAFLKRLSPSTMIAALIILALALWVIAEAIVLRVGGVGRD